MTKPFQWKGEVLLIQCHLQPQSSCDEIVGIHNDKLKIKITAPPVDGKANVHLIKYIAKVFGVAKRKINIVSGETSRHKILSIESPTKLPNEAVIASN